MTNKFFGRLGFVFLVLFFFGFVSADAFSEIGVNVTLLGCEFPIGNSILTVSLDSCSELEGYAGEYYCGHTTEDGWDTSEYNLGCARGYVNFSEYEESNPSPLQLRCCPGSQICEYNSTEGFSRCVPTLASCNWSMTEVQCEADDVGGLYYDLGGGVWGCLCPGYEPVCGDYLNESICEEDPLGAAYSSSELEIFDCNGTRFIRTGEICSWDAGSCWKVDAFKQEIHDNITYKEFSCSSIFTVDACVDGKQNVNWTSTSNPLHNLTDVPEDCIIAADCDNGTMTRFCGAPLVKLPGFSLFGLFVSLFIIGVYYLLSVKFKYYEELELL